MVVSCRGVDGTMSQLSALAIEYIGLVKPDVSACQLDGLRVVVASLYNLLREVKLCARTM